MDTDEQLAASIDAVDPSVFDAMVANQSPGESWTQTLAKLLPTLVMADAQRRLLNVQLQRAQQGLPPLDTSQYGVGANVNVGLSDSTQKLLMFGGLAILGIFALNKYGK